MSDVQDQTSERPPISTLVSQLADDTVHFARAEMAWLRAEAGERVDYALPGLALIVTGLALGIGALVALLTGLVFWLAPLITPPLAALVVFALGSGGAFLAVQAGTARLKRALKKKDER